MDVLIDKKDYKQDDYIIEYRKWQTQPKTFSCYSIYNKRMQPIAFFFNNERRECEKWSDYLQEEDRWEKASHTK